MSNFTFILSQGPFHSRFPFTNKMVKQLKAQGHRVTVFLVQNGTLSARDSPAGAPLKELASAGVEILADDFSLQERGIVQGEIPGHISVASLERVVDDLAAGHKVIWQ
ncbi:DsrE family protein [Sansalvadorimonas verongulae]|uniref:DsrE family protein n=1 Tax=Sansalvadorimonas verongulae TaxID=2172824 RepID=UPI0012BCBC72|nr:DsrE family protein [Sansalvadorimonas verongulae]MTI13165.1 multidrug transporter [Sansalvadorimonas verongulae]